MTLFDEACAIVQADAAMRGLTPRHPLPFRPTPTMKMLIAELFRALGQTTTPEQAVAIGEEAGAHGAALIEIATLAARRVHALRCRQQQDTQR